MASITEKIKSNDWFYEYAESNQEYFSGRSERIKIYLEFDKLSKARKYFYLHEVPSELQEEFLKEYKDGAWKRNT